MSGKRATDGAAAAVATPRGLQAPSVLASFRYAGAGLHWAWRTQRNLRVHIGAAVLVLVAIPSISLSAVEVALLLGAIAGVIAAELFNTAAEALVDLVCPEAHPLARITKDVAAAGVMITAAGAAVMGTAILWPHLRQLF